MGLSILATGSAHPRRVLTNDDLAQMVETSDEWIVSRTGIHSRYVAETETALSLAREAGAQALAAAGYNAVSAAGFTAGSAAGSGCATGRDSGCDSGRNSGSGADTDAIKLVLCASITADAAAPSLACYLQRDLGLPSQLLAFDVNAACSGFVYALIAAERLLNEGETALLVGSEVLSHVVDFTDRNTCVLFGDGAGAAVVRKTTGRFEWLARAQGDDVTLSVRDYIRMDGPEVFRFAVEALVSGARQVVEQAGWALADIEHFVCHQANQRIIAAAARRLGLPLERFFVNLARFGNTSAASIPLALDELARSGRLLRGQRLVLAGFGAGLTSGAVCMEY
ncbi:MAG: beta-ketoacyl-ACP synthase 3 [Coriobacteriales bacterium]|jgi:3-oxoacyl-[acyl-carrier-protein] synthase-3|nr:beta-ketoacyl-ACP synthase 3 [Coriobacteriales bacterium]